MAQTVGARLQEIDIDILAGEPLDFLVPVEDDDDVLQNPATWSGVAKIGPHAGGRTLHTLTLTFSSSGVRVTADPEDTATWADWSDPLAKWDLWVTPPAEDSRPLARGRVLVRSSTSKG